MSLNKGIIIHKIEGYSQIYNIVHTLVTVPYLMRACYYYGITSKSLYDRNYCMASYNYLLALLIGCFRFPWVLWA